MTRLEKAALDLGNKLHRAPLSKTDSEARELEAAAVEFAAAWRAQHSRLRTGLIELRDAKAEVP